MTKMSGKISSSLLFSVNICEYCNKSLSRRDKLVKHIRVKHPGSPVPTPLLTKCKSAMSSPEKEGKVLAPVDGPGTTDTKKFHCFCGKSLSRMDKLESHIRKIHSQSGKEDEKKDKENRNIGVDSPVYKRDRKCPTPCPYCPLVLSRRDRLKPHILSKHPGKKVPVKIISTLVPPKVSSDKPLKNCTQNKKHDFKNLKYDAKKCQKEKTRLNMKGKAVLERDGFEKAGSDKKEKLEQAAKKEGTKDLDWKKIWTSGNPVFVKFNFSRSSKRKRTDSEISFDLETLESPLTAGSVDNLPGVAVTEPPAVRANSKPGKSSATKAVNTPPRTLSKFIPDPSFSPKPGFNHSALRTNFSLKKKPGSLSVKSVFHHVGRSQSSTEDAPKQGSTLPTPLYRSTCGAAKQRPSPRPPQTLKPVLFPPGPGQVPHMLGTDLAVSSPSLIEAHRRSLETSGLLRPTSPTKKKIKILQCITYK